MNVTQTKPLAKVVIPAKAGIQRLSNRSKRLDSRFRGNDIFFFPSTPARCLLTQPQTAVLIHHEIEFPRTHDLVPLLNFIRQKVDIPLEVEQGQPLNRYSIEARYPDDWYPIDRQEATHAMKLARNVRDTVRRLMPKDVLEG